MSSIQIIATLFSLSYIFFATKNKAICFLFGAVASACWAYESFYNLNLKFDAILQLFYVFMSFYGAYHWTRGNNKETVSIKSLDLKWNALFVLLGVLVSIACANVALQFFDTKYAYIDALTTGFSIIATFLLAQRYIENWIYWLFINPVYMYIYYKSGGILFAMISLIYFIMAIKGYFDWKREMLAS